MANWNRRFMDVAELVATWSKDRSTKVGAVIVDSNTMSVKALGYNGFPRLVDDDVEARHERPAKYKWTEHAERNALYNALANNTPVFGSTMYITWYPCADCARAIIQSGVGAIVCGRKPDPKDPVWGESFGVVDIMLEEAGIIVVFIEDLD